MYVSGAYTIQAADKKATNKKETKKGETTPPKESDTKKIVSQEIVLSGPSTPVVVVAVSNCLQNVRHYVEKQ